MGAKGGKPAAGAPPPPPAGPPRELIHTSPVSWNTGQVKAAAIARSQREAYELDASDGIIDGKYYGAQIKLIPEPPPRPLSPAAASYHSIPHNRHATVPPHYNDPRPVYPVPVDAYGGPSRAAMYARSTLHVGNGSVVRPADGGVQVVHLDDKLPPAGFFIRASAPPLVAPACTTYCHGPSYDDPMAGIHLPPHELEDHELQPQLPPQESRSMTRSGLEFPTNKSYYDTYSRFAKVEFHRPAKAPYSHLLATNQTRPIGELILPKAPPTTDVPPAPQRFFPLPVPRRQFAPDHYFDEGVVDASEYAAQPQVEWDAVEKPPRVEVPTYDDEPSYTDQHNSYEQYNPPHRPFQPPAPPVWDESDPTTLGGYDADTSARMAFRRYDTDANGFLDVYEFMAAMKVLGKGTSFAEAKEVFNQIDTDGGGSIEEDEFVRWYVRNFSQIRESNDPKMLAQSIFRKYDTDGNGTLDVEEFVGAMRELGLGYTMEDAQFVFDTFDNDGGGTIDEREFIEQYYEQWLQQQ